MCITVKDGTVRDLDTVTYKVNYTDLVSLAGTAKGGL